MIKEISVYYTSSQLCLVCRNKNTLVKNLSVREWECSNCHILYDRDALEEFKILY